MKQSDLDDSFLSLLTMPEKGCLGGNTFRSDACSGDREQALAHLSHRQEVQVGTALHALKLP
ncbi:hypothetical protein [Brachymonas sp.]|uniref:hypothetical protein n=1 Tax=unclassified Brachymonas TaxID=2621329 RepID=UPI0035B29D58